jgi:hypothetical protein
MIPREISTGPWWIGGASPILPFRSGYDFYALEARELNVICIHRLPCVESDDDDAHTGTLGIGVDHLLHGYCDADWAEPHSDKGLSTSGFAFKLAGGLISWASKKQACVALSTTESEYIAEALACQEAIWLVQLLTEIAIDDSFLKPIPIYADNNGAIALASNPEFHAATKHIAVRFHKLREVVQDGLVCFIKIPAEMAADGLTKPLQKVLFKRWITQLGLAELGGS